LGYYREQISNLASFIEDLYKILQTQDEENVYHTFLKILLNEVSIDRKGPKHFIANIEKELRNRLENDRILCSYVEDDLLVGIRDLRIYDPKEGLVEFSQISRLHNYLVEKKENATKFYVYIPIDIDRGKVYNELKEGV
jgi:hypothetical protein